MWRDDLPVEMTRLVTPRAVCAYAEGLGWQKVDGVNGKIAVYVNPKAPLRQLIVPLDEGFDDYPDRTAEAVRRLAEFENRPPREILNHLLLPPADVLRFREVSAEAEAGILSLDHGVRVVTGMRKLLLAAAHSVLAPRAYHPRLSRAEAEEFVARCRLGQIERGSFVLTVACPLDLQAGLFGPNSEPFARRVTSLLMASLQDLSQGTDTPHLEELADVSRHAGISANLCESLLLLKPTGERAYLTVSATWSRVFLPPTRELRRDVQLRQEVFEAAEALAPRLRSLPQPRVDRFFGFVDELRGTPGPNEPRPSGEVRFTLFDQEEEIHAKADLNVTDYAEAIAAHAVTELVTFKGILHRLPRLNRIDNVTDFRRVRLDDNGWPINGPATNDPGGGT
jgi:hypothetical protein